MTAPTVLQHTGPNTAEAPIHQRGSLPRRAE